MDAPTPPAPCGHLTHLRRNYGWDSERNEWEMCDNIVPPAQDELRCAAMIWPSHADRWIQCPGHVKPDGSCTAYGTQHRVPRSQTTRAQSPGRTDQ